MFLMTSFVLNAFLRLSITSIMSPAVLISLVFGKYFLFYSQTVLEGSLSFFISDVPIHSNFGFSIISDEHRHCLRNFPQLYDILLFLGFGRFFYLSRSFERL